MRIIKSIPLLDFASPYPINAMKRILYIILLIACFGCQNKQSKSDSYSIIELKTRYGSGDFTQWPAPQLDSSVQDFQEIGSLPPLNLAQDDSIYKAKRLLGKLLFYDPRLSGSKQIACASCHDPDLGWADGKRVAHGHNRATGERNTMSILNIAYVSSFFWDGRAETLAEQAREAMENPIEMNQHMQVSVKSVREIPGYVPYFKQAFGESEISSEKLLEALAVFEKSIVSRKSRFDRFIAGDTTQLSNDEVQGLHLFRTKARCINCHHSPLFSDGQFHDLGLSYYGRKYEDLGRYQVTKKAEDVGKFRTPSLRELAHTAPYMHNGLFPHLEGIINMYNAGMVSLKPNEAQQKDSLFPVKSELLKPLNLNTKEQEQLEAFLLSLSSTIYREPAPEQLPQ
jgi:cytochrome c peroxidase